MDEALQAIENSWKSLERSLSTHQDVSILSLCLHLVVGGLLALYIRFLYQKCSNSASDADAITRVFPLLTVITTVVIAVVKSSLALSLGLVGALSIVRFRAAIKEPEELVYLFLCIAIGLALGAEQMMLALVLVTIATLFIVGMYFGSGRKRREKLLLTVTTALNAEVESDGKADVLGTIESVVGSYTLQRCDIENDRTQIRVVLGESHPRKTTQLIKTLHEQLPGCDISYVNLNSTL